jgi:hypothetical protein
VIKKVIKSFIQPAPGIHISMLYKDKSQNQPTMKEDIKQKFLYFILHRQHKIIVRVTYNSCCCTNTVETILDVYIVLYPYT